MGRSAAWFALPNPLRYGIEFSAAAIIGICLMAIVSAIETVGDVSGITKGGAGREATDRGDQGRHLCRRSGHGGGRRVRRLPNTSFSQNVGLVAMTGVMSRHVVTIGAIFLIVCGLIPKVGASISTVPIEVLGGGVIVMFGMVCAAGVSMLSDVNWNRRNMVIFAVVSGLLPAAFLAIILNLILPHELADEMTEEMSGGMAGHKHDDHVWGVTPTLPTTGLTRPHLAGGETRRGSGRRLDQRLEIARRRPLARLQVVQDPEHGLVVGPRTLRSSW